MDCSGGGAYEAEIINDGANTDLQTPILGNIVNGSDCVSPTSPPFCSKQVESAIFHMSCPGGETISDILFAVYGLVKDYTCGTYAPGFCSIDAKSTVRSMCLQREYCEFRFILIILAYLVLFVYLFINIISF